MARFTLVSKLAFLFIFFVHASQVNAGNVKHVIVISVDGLGARLLHENDAPNLKRLASETRQAERAETVIPPKTVPGHTSMLTGIDPSKHKLVHNELDEKLVKVSVPTIFDLIKVNGLTSSAIFGKPKLEYIFDTGAPSKIILPKLFPFGDFYGRFPSTITDRAKKEIKKRKPSLLFIHHSLVDTMGHWFTWGSWPQKNALKAVDESIGKIVDAAKKHYPVGSFALIVTADHGGHGGSHGQMKDDGTLQSPETDLLIPWIVVGTKLADPKRVIKVYDTAPAVAHLLGLKVPADWNWQGTSPLSVD